MDIKNCLVHASFECYFFRYKFLMELGSIIYCPPTLMPGHHCWHPADSWRAGLQAALCVSEPKSARRGQATRFVPSADQQKSRRAVLPDSGVPSSSTAAGGRFALKSFLFSLGFPFISTFCLVLPCAAGWRVWGRSPYNAAVRPAHATALQWPSRPSYIMSNHTLITPNHALIMPNHNLITSNHDNHA